MATKRIKPRYPCERDLAADLRRACMAIPYLTRHEVVQGWRSAYGHRRWIVLVRMWLIGADNGQERLVTVAYRGAATHERGWEALVPHLRWRADIERAGGHYWSHT